MRSLYPLCFLLTLGTAVGAQKPTLPERVAEERTDVALTINVDGPPVTLAVMFKETDRVVRGVIGNIVGHLSEDGRDIYSTCELLNPQVLSSSKPVQLPRPGMVLPTILLTQPGGTVPVGQFTATIRYDDVPPLVPGMDVVVLLHDDGEKHKVAGRYGIFEIRDSVIQPLVRRPGEHKRFAGMNADSFLAEVSRLRMDKPPK